MLALVGRVALPLHRLGKGFAGAGGLFVTLCPNLPRAPQPVANAPLVSADNAALLDPAPEAVLLDQVRLSRGEDRVWRSEPARPITAVAVDRPLQDARLLDTQLRREVRIDLVRRDRHGERDEVQPAPHGLVDAAERGFVVARY